MKKFMLIMVMLLLTVQGFSQYKVVLSGSKYSYDLTGTAKDSVTVNDTMWSQEVVITQPQALYYQIRLKLTELTSPATATVTLMGKTYLDEDYTSIASTTYVGTGTDTTITFTQVSTKQFYRYYLVKVVYGANKSKVTFLKMIFKY